MDKDATMVEINPFAEDAQGGKQSLPHSGLIIQCHTDTPYRQDPNLGEDKGGLLGPKNDKYKVCSLLDKALQIFGPQAAEDSQFCQALRNQNRSKGLVSAMRFTQ